MNSKNKLNIPERNSFKKLEFRKNLIEIGYYDRKCKSSYAPACPSGSCVSQCGGCP